MQHSEIFIVRGVRELRGEKRNLREEEEEEGERECFLSLYISFFK
jgi:hypothetical protein